MKSALNKVLSVSLVILSLLLYVTSVNAETIDVSNNSGDTKVNVSVNSTTKVDQNNSTNVNNNVNSEANTGGNSTNGNNGGTTIKTGDATTNTTINNEFNKNKAKVECCTPAPKSPTSTHKPGSPTATPGPGGQGGPPGDGGNGGNGGGGPASSAQGQVLGLSATAGPEDEKWLFYGLGIVCLGSSLALFRGAKFLHF